MTRHIAGLELKVLFPAKLIEFVGFGYVRQCSARWIALASDQLIELLIVKGQRFKDDLLDIGYGADVRQFSALGDLQLVVRRFMRLVVRIDDSGPA
jgi:hypothetical protein